MPLIIYVLGLSTFALGTSEFMVAGMLPSLTSAFNVSIADIGQLISLYALGMVVGGPLLTVLLLNLQVSNKSALIVLLFFYAGAQSVGALSNQYEMMAIARIATGVSGAAIFGVSISACITLVKAELEARALSVVIGGLVLSMVLGVPLATFIDYHFGWRASFWLIVFLMLLCVVVIIWLLPPDKQHKQVRLSEEFAAFKKPELWAAYATSGLIIGATFAGFSYFAPILLDVTGFSITSIPWLLGMFGVSSVVGNFIVGRYTMRYYFLIMVIGLVTLISALALFAIFAEYKFVSLVLMLLIGLAGVPMNPAMIYRIMTIVPLGPLVSTLHTSVINIGLGLGTWNVDRRDGFDSRLWLTCPVMGWVCFCNYRIDNVVTL